MKIAMRMQVRLLPVWFLGLFAVRPAVSQTYAQLVDLDPANQVGPRLTSTVVRNKLSRELFAQLSSKITLVDAVANPPIVYEPTRPRAHKTSRMSARV